MSSLRPPRQLRLVLVILGLAACASGCLSSTLISAKHSPRDLTVVSPRLVPMTRIMVIPPSGTVRGQYESAIALFEREFLRGGITVISGAVTGRVVIDSSGNDRRMEAAASLSDAERALVMAKDSGADAILQIGRLEWSDSNINSRFFVCCPKGSAYSEVTQAEYEEWPREKAIFASHWLSFVGRLLDVKTGEVLASFDVGAGANFSLPSNQVVPLGKVKRQRGTGRHALEEVWVEENFGDVNWTTARTETTERVIATVASRIMARSATTTAQQ